MPTPISEAEDLVVNWHVTEACNFKCRYCFASWEQNGAKPELWRNQAQTRGLLKALYGFFNNANLSNSLGGGLCWRSLRLSLAGGEPTLLGGSLTDIAAQAKALGFRVSLITNGSRPDVIASTCRYLDMIGLSIDSADQATNAAIGRNCRAGTQIFAGNPMAIIAQARAVRPDIVVKVNTVVSSANAGEDLSGLIAGLHPDRWKVMRMLPVQTDVLAVDAETFRAFVNRHRAFHRLMTVEDHSDMDRSYVMVDPQGRFFQNGAARRGYLYSRPIPEVGVEAAFGDVEFRPDGFAARYPTIPS